MYERWITCLKYIIKLSEDSQLREYARKVDNKTEKHIEKQMKTKKLKKE